MARYLTGGFGSKATPICDNVFGSGKTKFVYKFRELLDGLNWSGKSDAEWDKLAKAVYLHVPFAPYGELEPTSQKCMHVVLNTVRSVVAVSCRCSVADYPPVDDVEGFIMALARLCSPESPRLLFHFDDVGSYEALGNKLGGTMLSEMWRLGDRLRGQGHYIVMTGRSTLLHLLGSTRVSLAGYQSPDKTVIIPLPPLSVEAVQKMIKEFGLERIIDLADDIHTLTGGIPRAVYTVVSYFLANPECNSLQDSLVAVMAALATWCPQTLVSDDMWLFQRCLELSWAGVLFTNDSVICGEHVSEYLTSVIARLGIFRHFPAGDTTQFELLVPLFVMVNYLPSVRSLHAISQHDNKGDRLERAFRRVLQLRCSLAPYPDWTSISLSALDVHCFPFPKPPLTACYPFPKISRSGKKVWHNSDLRSFMTAAHDGSIVEGAVVCSMFVPAALPSLFALMEIGQYYQTLPMSGSADSLIRCATDTVLCFQFKNYQDPFKEKELEDEVVKCAAAGWKVYLVVVCTAGNTVNDDYHRTIHDVSVLVLSAASVEHFMGHKTVDKMSGRSALEDSQIRIGFSPDRSQAQKMVTTQLREMSLGQCK